MNKYVKLSGAAIVASLGALALAPTAAADTTLVLFEHDNVQYQADLSGPGPGPGDQFIFAGDVYDRPGGMFLGTMGGSATTLTGNEKSGQTAFNATLNLAGGQIVVQSVADTAAVIVRGDRVPISIVGGTGIYQNARGTGTIQVPPDVPNQTDANFVLNLTG
jgi:Allene oxide cyclase barrel like domain